MEDFRNAPFRNGKKYSQNSLYPVPLLHAVCKTVSGISDSHICSDKFHPVLPVGWLSEFLHGSGFRFYSVTYRPEHAPISLLFSCPRTFDPQFAAKAYDHQNYCLSFPYRSNFFSSGYDFRFPERICLLDFPQKSRILCSTRLYLYPAS